MENLNYLVYVLYVCFAVPVALMLLALDKKNRLTILFLLFGITAAISVGRINGTINRLICGTDDFYLCSTFSPIVEEIAKGLPVILLCTFSKNLSKKDMFACAYADGLGFAIFENVVYFCQNYKTANFVWAFFRGIGAGLMHSLCTCIIAAGIIFLRKNKKLYWVGLFSFASFAMTYHGAYNTLLLSGDGLLQNIGVFIPISTYLLVLAYVFLQKKKKNIEKKA